jgi:hypothetical protein
MRTHARAPRRRFVALGVRIALPLACIAVLALALAGCGAATPDLFLLTRDGSVAGAHLTLLVNDGGTVRCNGGAARPLPDPRLLEARDIADKLSKDAKLNLRLPPPPGSILRFRFESQDGTVIFSDSSAATHPELGPLVAFTRTVAQDVCGLPR